MSISNLRFDEGIAKINSNDNKPLDTLITEKTQTLMEGQENNLGKINVDGEKYKPCLKLKGDTLLGETGIIGSAPRYITADSTRLYLDYSTSVRVYDKKTRSLITTISGVGSSIVKMKTSNGKLIVLLNGAKFLKVYNTSDYTLVGNTSSLDSNIVDFDVRGETVYALSVSHGVYSCSLSNLLLTRNFSISSGVNYIAVGENHMVVLGNAGVTIQSEYPFGASVQVEASDVPYTSAYGLCCDNDNFYALCLFDGRITPVRLSPYAKVVQKGDEIALGSISEMFFSEDRIFCRTQGVLMCFDAGSLRRVDDFKSSKNMVGSFFVDKDGLYLYNTASSRIEFYGGYRISGYEKE